MKLVMIGFMGTGKTTIGRELARKLNISFIDMDKEIEKREKKTISKIFEINGEQYFRNLETRLLKELIEVDNIVISTGGGIVTIEENLRILNNESGVIFLDANAQTIINHLSNEIEERPLLKGSKDLNKTINDLLNKRYDKYNNVFDIKIDVNEKNVAEVISQILVNIR